jgi:predicted DNA-binding ribbon-helix-helix protein
MRKKPTTPFLSKHWTVYPVGKKTNVSLEPEFWEAFHEIAAKEKLSLTDLTGQIAATCVSNLSSSIRVYVLDYYRALQPSRRMSEHCNKRPN